MILKRQLIRKKGYWQRLRKIRVYKLSGRKLSPVSEPLLPLKITLPYAKKFFKWQSYEIFLEWEQKVIFLFWENYHTIIPAPTVSNLSP